MTTSGAIGSQPEQFGDLGVVHPLRRTSALVGLPSGFGAGASVASHERLTPSEHRHSLGA